MGSQIVAGVMFVGYPYSRNVDTMRAGLVVPCDVIALSTHHVVFVTGAEDVGAASRVIRYIPIECRFMLNPPLAIEVTKRKSTRVGLVERAGA